MTDYKNIKSTTVEDQSCEQCEFYSALKTPRRRGDGAVIRGYCFKYGDKNHNYNMGKGFPVFLPEGRCEDFKRHTRIKENGSYRTAPTVDAAPLRHGMWKATDAYMTDECSICGTRINIEEFDEAAFHPMYGRVPLNYCPYCGTKMDGENETERRNTI